MSGAGGPVQAPQAPPQTWFVLEQATEISLQSTPTHHTRVNALGIVLGNEDFVVTGIRNTMDQVRAWGWTLSHAQVMPIQNSAPNEIVENRSAWMYIRHQVNQPHGVNGNVPAQWREIWYIWWYMPLPVLFPPPVAPELLN